MAEKRSPGQRLNQNKSKKETAKYLEAVEAWIGESDKLEENYEDIPVVGNLKNNTTIGANGTKLGAGKSGKGKKGKGFDEANDNINVDGMLMNIMEALKEEPQHKKAENKKRVYSPLQRTKKVAPESDAAKPVLTPDLMNNSSNVRIEEADKTIKNQSPFSVDQEANPFAKAFFPSAKIANDTVENRGPPLDQRVLQANVAGTTLGDLSAIAPEPVVKEHLDSRASFPNFLGSNPKLGLNQGYDQVLSPILSPAVFLESPDKVHNPLVTSQNLPSDRYIERKGSRDSQNPLWSNMVTELETEQAVEPIQRTEINKKEEKKDRRAKAIDLLAMLAADEELGNVKEDKSKEKSKLGVNTKLKRGNSRVSPLTKKKIKKINEEYEAEKALEEEQAQIEENTLHGPSSGPSPMAREDWHFLLGSETPEPRFNQTRDERFYEQPTPSLAIGRPADETRDTALFKEGNRPGSGMSNIFINDGSGNAVGFHKEYAKTNILLEALDSSPTHLLSNKKKVIEIYEEEGPFSVEFRKRAFDTEEESFIYEHDDPKDLIEKKPTRTRTAVETDEFDAAISKGLINFFVGFRKRTARLDYLVQEVRKPDYTLDTFFERNFTFFKGKLQITKNFFFLFVLLTGIMLYFIIDTLVSVYSLEPYLTLLVSFGSFKS